MYQARNAKSVVVKYLNTTTIIENTKFYNTTLTNDMIFTKGNVSTIDEKVKLLYGY